MILFFPVARRHEEPEPNGVENYLYRTIVYFFLSFFLSFFLPFFISSFLYFFLPFFLSFGYLGNSKELTILALELLRDEKKQRKKKWIKTAWAKILLRCGIHTNSCRYPH